MKRQRSSLDGGAGCSAAAPSPGMRPENSEFAYLSSGDVDALDCGVCCLPLKPPIFQCEVGHVVCSPCSDKLKRTRKCHVCGADTSSSGRGYRRCHAMERVVESVHVQCPNAAYGCAARPAYCDKQAHLQRCLHAPCHCPGEACGFAGTMDALLGHLADVHGWPCSAKVKKNEMNYILLNDGFNFFVLEDEQGATTAAAAGGGNSKFLFLLDVVRQPLSCAISVLLIHPHAAADSNDQRPCFNTMSCELSYSRFRSLGYYNLFAHIKNSRGDQLIDHQQKTMILIACTDLSNGLPNSDKRLQFVVPSTALTGEEKNAINVGFYFYVR